MQRSSEEKHRSHIETENIFKIEDFERTDITFKVFSEKKKEKKKEQ